MGQKAISRGHIDDPHSKELAQPHQESRKHNLEKYIFFIKVAKIKRRAFSHTVGEKILFGRQLWQYL